MKNKELAKRIKELRIRKGLSQEELAEITGLSLRTVQRIENGESEPRGDSLRRLSVAFDVSPDEIVDWTVKEDNGFLLGLNLSALTFIVFPLLGILVPLIVWISKKDKVKNVNELAKDLLNFQITWTIILFFGYVAIILSAFAKIHISGDVDAGLISSRVFLNLIFLVVMYAFNIVIVVVNTFRLRNYTLAKYFPRIRFVR
uniref:helix-turn-helix domain-containing protein n=1 Tax=uncultured Draconibacterium sp. TaxID=1573823 RepID=UPI0032173F66